jgi:type I restriction enzyme M protein
MTWIAPTERDTASVTLEKRLWDATGQFRANSGLKAQEYSGPILGIIFLRFAEVRFAAQRAKLELAGAITRRGSRVDEPAAYHAERVLYLVAEARFDFLLQLPEAEDVGAKVNAAMREIEKHNPQLAGVLPKTYNLFTRNLLKNLLKKVSEIPVSVDYDAFGRIYEYFLGEYASTEGQKGGEFYTPSCIVRLLTGLIEPYHGLILDGSSLFPVEPLFRIPIALPPPQLIEAFDQVAASALNQIDALSARFLHRTGDLLLPRLMSGQVELVEGEPST